MSEDFGAWVTWAFRKEDFERVSRDLVGVIGPSERQLATKSYQKTVALLRKIGDPNYSGENGLEVFATEMNPVFHSYFLEKRIVDREFPGYVKDVFIALEKIDIATDEQKQKASRLVSYFAVYCGAQMREAVSEGNT